MDSQNNTGVRTPTLSEAETQAIAHYVETLKAYEKRGLAAITEKVETEFLLL